MGRIGTDLFRPQVRGPGALMFVLACLHQAPSLAQPFMAVRMSAGEGATVISTGQRIGLGEPEADIDAGGGIKVRVTAPSGAPTVCCMRWVPGSLPAGLCLTDRQVGLESTRAQVLARYGASTSSNSNTLKYPGVQFTLSTGAVVDKVCIVRRQ